MDDESHRIQGEPEPRDIDDEPHIQEPEAHEYIVDKPILQDSDFKDSDGD
jgi:hypothetical protein